MKSFVSAAVLTALGCFSVASFAAENYGTIKNCVNKATVVGKTNVAGIVCKNFYTETTVEESTVKSGVISQTYNTGTVKAESSDASGNSFASGGVVYAYGNNSSLYGYISGLANHGKIYATGNYAAGVVCKAGTVEQCFNEGCNIISFGEMGIGNTSASSMWMTCLTGIPLDKCVGAGSGLDKNGVNHKYNVLKKSLENYKGDGSTLDVMRYFGGYEMVMAVGGMLKAAELKMIILVDGFIMTNCVLAASRLYPDMLHYCIFGHCGDEAGHRRVLDSLNAKPLLDLGLRLGEGSGAICAYPIVDSAVRMINEMHTFEQEAITKYF